MQLSPVNLLIAAQQAGNTSPALKAQVPKEAAGTIAAAQFEPLKFSSAAVPQEPSAKMAQSSEGAFQRPGSQINIVV